MIIYETCDHNVNLSHKLHSSVKNHSYGIMTAGAVIIPAHKRFLRSPQNPALISSETPCFMHLNLRKEIFIMKVLFLEYPPCSTCQKAKKWLDSHNVSYESRHIKEKNPTAEN